LRFALPSSTLDSGTGSFLSLASLCWESNHREWNVSISDYQWCFHSCIEYYSLLYTMWWMSGEYKQFWWFKNCLCWLSDLRSSSSNFGIPAPKGVFPQANHKCRNRHCSLTYFVGCTIFQKLCIRELVVKI
jgi:hypothetical protein